jgi:hypothetical protein
MRVSQRRWVILGLFGLLGVAAFTVREGASAPESDEHPCDRRVPMPPGVWDVPPTPASPLVGSWAGLWDGFRASRLVVTSVAAGEADLTYGIVEWGNGVGPYRGGFHRERAPVGEEGQSFAWGPLSFRFDPYTGTLLGTFVENGRLGGSVVMSRCPARR